MSDSQIKPPMTKDGLMGYFEQFLGGERGETSADVISDVVLLAVSEEREACAATVESLAGGPGYATTFTEAIRRRGQS